MKKVFEGDLVMQAKGDSPRSFDSQFSGLVIESSGESPFHTDGFLGTSIESVFGALLVGTFEEQPRTFAGKIRVTVETIQ